MGNITRRIERVAAKGHICVECRGRIKKGESHAYWSGVSEGRRWPIRMCLDCESIMNRGITESRAMDDEWPNFGELKTWLKELDLDTIVVEFEANALSRAIRTGGAHVDP